MTRHPAPPWCLHWNSDGELIGADRQDLLATISLQESGPVRTRPDSMPPLTVASPD